MTLSGAGKRIRWSRFVDDKTGRGIIVAIDHGLTYGPISGLNSAHEIAGWLGSLPISGIIAHKGMIERLGNAGALNRIGVMVQLNGMSCIAESPDTKEMLTTIEAALRLGADAVSVQLNFETNNNAHNLGLLGSVVDEAQRYCLPVLAMIYDKVPCADPAERIKRQRHLMRAAYELGVDAIKTQAPEPLSDAPALLAGLAEDLPVFFSGGILTSDSRLAALAQAVVESGGAGLCLGRNLFQRDQPAAILDQLREIILPNARRVLVT